MRLCYKVFDLYLKVQDLITLANLFQNDFDIKQQKVFHSDFGFVLVTQSEFFRDSMIKLCIECHRLRQKNFGPDKAREQLEEISNNYTYEYLLVIMNSRFSNIYLNGIRRHKLENFFYPDDFRRLPIKPLKDQSFFIKVVEILQFLYQSDGDKNTIQFLDDKLLNFIIYELYFEDKLKEEGLFHDLLNFVKNDFKNITFNAWIKLKLKYNLTEDEKTQMLDIENSNNRIIEEIYNNIDKETINQKIESMKESDWVKKIENKR